MRLVSKCVSLSAALAAALLALPAKAQEAADHYHWRPVEEDGRSRPWAILLPGGGGLEVFGDREHYFRWAEWLNERGIDVLVVHYQAAGEYLADAQHETPGETQARIVHHALETERTLGRMDQRCQGIVLGWSYGGEGVLTLASQETAGLAAAVAFYPLVRFQPENYAAQMPVLVLQGTADDTTTSAQLGAFIGTVQDGEIDLALFADAGHGFDVASLTQPVSWNSGTFAYHPQAAEDAAAVLERQLIEWEIGFGRGCALD